MYFKWKKTQWLVKKHCVVNILEGIWETFLYQNNLNHISYKLRYKFTFILFLSIDRNQKQVSNFRQDGGLVTRDICIFCLHWVVLYFKSMLNSIKFYKRTFLHIILACIMLVPWLYHSKKYESKVSTRKMLTWAVTAKYKFGIEDRKFRNTD